MNKKNKAFGLWSSSVHPKMMAGYKRFESTSWSGETLIWREQRSGWGAIVIQRPGEAPRDLNTKISAIGGVGYGGGSFCIYKDICFFTGADGRVYRIPLDAGIERPITPQFGSAAAPICSPDGKWLAYIHSYEEQDCIAIVDTDGKHWPQRLISGADFYMQPTWHPSGNRLVWVSWDHPQMPWDGSRLESAEINFSSGRPFAADIDEWAGGRYISVQQPNWNQDGSKLAYISDESGFLQLYIRDHSTGKTQRLSTDDGEYATPAWVQGLRDFCWTNATEIVAIKRQQGSCELRKFNLQETSTSIAIGAYQHVSQPAYSTAGRLAVIASSSHIPDRIISFALNENFKAQTHAFSTADRLPADHFSKMKPVSWTEKKDGCVIHANYYPPENPDFTSSGKPPAIIMIHGGPTSQSEAKFNPRNQFFTSRGFAVLDLNYRGSSGYGRDYSEALRGQWGVVDVEDALTAVSYLQEKGLADEHRIAIMGGSAGGYTVLQTLANHPGKFKAGVCLYGVSNLFTLDQGTHKFESNYCQSLIGPLPKHAATWRERSPLHRAKNISDQLAIYHGALDKVVPLVQAESIVQALKEAGTSHFYHVYDNEGHGWRHAENISHFYNSVLSFLQEALVLS